jgi:hypothetical protein
MRILKYELKVPGETTLELPYGHRVLHVGNQRNCLFIWVLVPGELRSTGSNKFGVYATGQEIFTFNDPTAFLGSVIFPESWTVWHVFRI